MMHAAMVAIDFDYRFGVFRGIKGGGFVKILGRSVWWKGEEDSRFGNWMGFEIELRFARMSDK